MSRLPWRTTWTWGWNRQLFWSRTGVFVIISGHALPDSMPFRYTTLSLTAPSSPTRIRGSLRMPPHTCLSFVGSTVFFFTAPLNTTLPRTIPPPLTSTSS